MPKLTQQSVPIQNFTQQNWSGGLNTFVPSDRIADNEAVDILNMEFDQDNNLVPRSGVAKFNFPGDTFATRITSIHYYENDAGNIYILYTSANKIFSSLNSGGALTDRTGIFSFPIDTIWHWKNFTGLAIGVNGANTASGFTNPVKVSGSIPTVVALGGTPPKCKFIEIWNNRVWVVDADNPSTLRASSLNNAEDWTTVGAAGTVTIDISKNDGDKITGIIAFRERLFVFKRTKIFVISADRVPITDPNNLRVDIYSPDIGCFSQNTIRVVLNDVLFLSEQGIASLVASEIVGSFNASIISQKVKEISNYFRNSDGIHAFVVDNADQYWLQIPQPANAKNINEAFVFDYRQIQQGIVRFVRMDNKVAGSAMASFYINGAKQYLIGSNSGESVFRAYRYIPKDRTLLNDDGLGFTRQLITKAFNLNLPFIRKLFSYFYLNAINITDNVVLTLSYTFDDNSLKTENLPISFSSLPNGAIWDVSLWDAGTWGGDNVINHRIKRRFRNSSFGRKAVKVQFSITNSTNSQSYVLGYLGFDFGVLNERLGNDVQ